MVLPEGKCDDVSRGISGCEAQIAAKWLASDYDLKDHSNLRNNEGRRPIIKFRTTPRPDDEL
jgi:hypothetical protein